MSLITNPDHIYKKGVIGNVRKAQEDSHDVFKTPYGDVFVVCDGMGGHVGGAVASSTAVESIGEHLGKVDYPNPISALDGALQYANQRILSYSAEHPELKGMGTTACILMLKDDEAWIAHVGDSRIYLFFGEEKQLHRITKDHSYVQALVDAGQITDEQAEHHPNKNRILKALGIIPEVEPSFNFERLPILPKNGDIFLICSDGLSGMIPDATIQKVLANEELTLAQKGDRLIDLAMIGETVKPGGQDNCTVELIQIDNSSHEHRQCKSYNPVRAARTTAEPTSRPTPMPNPTPAPVAPPVVPPMPPKKPVSAGLIAAVVVVGLLLLGLGGWFIYQHSTNKVKVVENVEKVIDDIQKKLDENQKDIEKNETLRDKCLTKIMYWKDQKTQDSSEEPESHIVDLKKQLETIETELSKLYGERERLKKELKEKQDLLNEPEEDGTQGIETQENMTPEAEDESSKTEGNKEINETKTPFPKNIDILNKKTV